MTFNGSGFYTSTSKPPAQVKNILMMGDSLSDRGTLNKTLLLGCIPMSVLGGLKGKSPNGRFTNGLVWSDHVSAKIASDFTIKRVQKKWHMDDTDISDSVITHERKVMSAINDNYSLDDDNFINFYGRLWVRSYCVGGLTSHDYSWTLSSSIVRFFRRLIVSTLDEMCDKVLRYDEEHNLSYRHKAETLVVEWSGANDLITVNAKPSIDEVDKAIAARVANIKKLIGTGYRNFIVVNLPNLALTPLYQSLSKEKQDEAQACSEYFNSELVKACTQLNQDYPHCSVDAYDVNTMFEKIYHNPTPYLFDKEKLTIPYVDSEDFNDPADGISQARGYMFYDKIHPSADLHSLLASYFYDNLASKYELLEPNKTCLNKRVCLSEETLVQCFRKHYEEQLNNDKSSVAGFFGRKSSRLDYKNANLETILKHALNDGGERTFSVLQKMGWLEKNGRLMLNEPALNTAMDCVRPREKPSQLVVQ